MTRYPESDDQRARPWLYAVDYRTDEDLRKLGIKPMPRLWPTILLAVVFSAMLAWVTHTTTVDPLTAAVAHAVARLWS